MAGSVIPEVGHKAINFYCGNDWTSMAKGGLIMKQKVVAKVVAMVMAFLVTGCMPSAHVEAKIVREVEAGNETKEDHAQAATHDQSGSTTARSPPPQGRAQAQAPRPPQSIKRHDGCGDGRAGDRGRGRGRALRAKLRRHPPGEG